MRRTSPHLRRRVVVDSGSSLGQLHQTLPTQPFGAAEAVANDREFGNSIAADRAFIPDDGDRQRNGERISTAFAESAVNQLASRRMLKQQQMRWTERGAHLSLQIRTQVPNGDLRKAFGHWYPGMKTRSEEPVRLVA
jgi:hypothetical protein